MVRMLVRMWDGEDVGMVRMLVRMWDGEDVGVVRMLGGEDVGW